MRQLFDWWCDDGERAGEGDAVRPSDRQEYIRSLGGTPTAIKSRSPLQNDPAPPLNQPAPQGVRDVFLLSNPEHIRRALTDHDNFSNIPYAALGGAAFLLAMDPPKAGAGGVDWHAEQAQLVGAAFKQYTEHDLHRLARVSVEQAALTGLARSDFDLAEFAEQAALRYMGTLFGYGFQDHPLLEEASRTTYRALQYLAVGQHFVTEPGTLAAAQQTLGRLIARTSQLVDEYDNLSRSKRLHGWKPGRDWPTGVLPWSELGLTDPPGPVLKRLPKMTSPLSGRDRAAIAATVVAGTLGNIQSAVCLLVREWLHGPADELEAARGFNDADLEKAIEHRLAQLPPVPVLPRRTVKSVWLDLFHIPADTDCLLLLEGHLFCPNAHQADAGTRVWGGVAAGSAKQAMHACLGRNLSKHLVAALVRHTLQLKGVQPALDPLTGRVLKIERLWGFACTRYPLRYERERVRVQQNLIVSMRIKTPISDNAQRLRRLIAAGVPRIEHALNGWGHVHFAWFEFSDDDTRLVLRTIYDGPFESYLQHFALQAGDLFDQLFEYLEGAPPRPVAEHPQAFVETLRRYNLAPLAGYLYSAHPRMEAPQRRGGSTP
ncbi:MAG: hypothetical protein AD742_19465 [Methylibium sp. NZG]|nr:MAG: hypothetical protein AD742_19465 [Methylibium sp. NZG]